MQNTLVLTSFFMGLAGGPHCIAMCGAPCSGIMQSSGKYGIWQFHFGRLLGYSGLGALAASAIGGVAWLSSQTAALHPVWTFFHVLVMAWGLLLLLAARQPAWADNFGKAVWRSVRHFSQHRGGMMMTGVLWAFMPCGLLYSALLLAALSGSPAQGALSMAGFTVASSLFLLVGPWLWLKLKTGKLWFNENIGMRLAGLLLALTAGVAIWLDVTHQSTLFCSVS